MGIIKRANLIIYRIKEKGLEVFLVNPNEIGQDESWMIPQGNLEDKARTIALVQADKAIELDPVETKGELQESIAVEGDWHDIPSLKGLLKEDVKFVKDTIWQMMPDMERKGTFFAVKEAFKKVLPSQYETLKELKDILIDRNSTKYL